VRRIKVRRAYGNASPQPETAEPELRQAFFQIPPPEHPAGGIFVFGEARVIEMGWIFASSFALQAGTSPLVSTADWCASHAGCEKPNHFDPQMKIAFIAAAAALLAASCCPNAAPAPSKPAYVAPTK
jgi:hypothetical protein